VVSAVAFSAVAVSAVAIAEDFEEVEAVDADAEALAVVEEAAVECAEAGESSSNLIVIKAYSWPRARRTRWSL
jgi:DNA topoisomerase VI subunit A